MSSHVFYGLLGAGTSTGAGAGASATGAGTSITVGVEIVSVGAEVACSAVLEGVGVTCGEASCPELVEGIGVEVGDGSNDPKICVEDPELACPELIEEVEVATSGVDVEVVAGITTGVGVGLETPIVPPA